MGFANIGTYPLQHANREYNLRDFIKHHQFDVFGLAELNVHWKNVSAHQRLHERTRGWFESLHLNTAYWQGFHTNGVSQYGGTSLWSINQGAHRVESSGKDFRGLGRWVWTRYRGKAGVNIRIIIGYRPVPNKTGAASVWSQHKTYFDEHDIPGCPIELFQQDLLAELRKWQEDGDQLALLLDVNEDVRTSQFSRALQAIQLTEANVHFHGPDLPATHCEGSLPIDGVYVSPTLLGTLRCGYLPVIQDHRALFIDIPQTVAFGYDAPESKRPQARRLKTNDPRLVKKYLDHFKSVVLKHHLPERAARLADAAQFPLTVAQAEEWEWIDSI